MAVKMRLIRLGKKRSALYRVVVIDGRSPRDGRFIEQIGRYDPNQDPSLIEIDNERAVDWLTKGAQPTEPVAKLLKISGAMAQYQVKSGKVHTAAAKQAKTDAPTAHVVTPVPEPVAAPPAPETAAMPSEPTSAEVAEEAVADEAATAPSVEAVSSEPISAESEPTSAEVAEEVAEAEAESGIDASEEE